MAASLVNGKGLQTVPTASQQILPATQEAASITTAYIIWDEDPDNPYNWRPARKYTMTILLSCLTFNTLMSSTMVAPALPQISRDLHVGSNSQTQLILSIYVLAYAVGYFFWAPMSEVYGRKIILQVANLFFCVFNLLCGFAANKATITAARLLSGAGAAAPLALSMGIMGELFRPSERGRSLAAVTIISLLGPTVGPIIGGGIATRSASSWRWAFWSTTIFNAAILLISLRFLHESHTPTILRRRAGRFHGSQQSPHRTDERSTTMSLVTALKRPFHLLFTQPTLQGLVVHQGIAFGALYIVLSVLTTAFTNVYDQSLMIASLNYVSLGIGPTIGAQFCGRIADAIYRHKERIYLDAKTAALQHEEGFAEKEAAPNIPAEIRLYPSVPSMLLTTTGLLIFGWSVQYKVHWIVPNIGLVVFGAGNQASTQCTNAYVIDVFSRVQARDISQSGTKPVRLSMKRLAPSERKSIGLNWTASAMASIWSFKSLGGFAFPLFAIDMIHKLGWGWSCTLLGLTNLFIGLPVAIVLLCYGSRLREVGRRRIE